MHTRYHGITIHVFSIIPPEPMLLSTLSAAEVAMMETTQMPVALLTLAYLVSGFVVAAAYGPKLRAMRADLQATARSHSLASETLWTLCRLVSFAYVASIARDPVIGLIVALDLSGRFAIVATVIRAHRSPKLERDAETATFSAVAGPARHG